MPRVTCFGAAGASNARETVRSSAKGKCHPGYFPMPVNYNTLGVVRERVLGALSAPMYFLTLSLYMPSSLAVPRMGSPLRFAFCAALHLAV